MRRKEACFLLYSLRERGRPVAQSAPFLPVNVVNVATKRRGSSPGSWPLFLYKPLRTVNSSQTSQNTRF